MCNWVCVRWVNNLRIANIVGRVTYHYNWGPRCPSHKREANLDEVSLRCFRPRCCWKGREYIVTNTDGGWSSLKANLTMNSSFGDDGELPMNKFWDLELCAKLKVRTALIRVCGERSIVLEVVPVNAEGSSMLPGARCSWMLHACASAWNTSVDGDSGEKNWAENVL